MLILDTGSTYTYEIDLKNIPPTKDLIERGFVPKNGKIDIGKIYKKFENLSEQDLQIIEYSKKDLNI